MKHESLLHDLLIGVRIESLIDLLAGVGYDFSSWRENGGIEDDIHMLAAGCVFGRECGCVHQISHSDFTGNGICGHRLHLGSERHQRGGNDVSQSGGDFLLRVVSF